MLTKTTTAAVTIGALGIASTLTLGTSLGQASQPTPIQARSPSTAPRNVQTMLLDVPFQGGHTKFIDHGHNGEGPGDLFLSTDIPVFHHGTHEKIGEIDATELIVSNRHHGTVTGTSTLRLPGGTLEGGGVIRHADRPERGPVYSGTGQYLGLTGQVTIREDPKHQVSVLRIELIR